VARTGPRWSRAADILIARTRQPALPDSRITQSERGDKREIRHGYKSPITGATISEANQVADGMQTIHSGAEARDDPTLVHRGEFGGGEDTKIGVQPPWRRQGYRAVCRCLRLGRRPRVAVGMNWPQGPGSRVAGTSAPQA
jgi:hypothetical protein